MVAPALLMAGKFGLKALPLLGAVSGAAPGLKKGNIGEALLGGAFGYATGATGKGLTKAARIKGARMAGGMGVQNLLGKAGSKVGGLEGQKAVMSALTPERLQRAARIGIPLAGVGLTAQAAGVGNLVGGGGSMAGGQGGLGGGAAGLLGYGSVRGEGMCGVPLPPGMGPYGNIGPTGLPLDVLSPLGLDAGRRLRTIKDAEVLRDAQNIILPTVRKFSEQAKKDDFARSIATRGIAQNIATNAALTMGMAQAARQMGTTAAQQAGTALTTQYNY